MERVRDSRVGAPPRPLERVASALADILFTAKHRRLLLAATVLAAAAWAVVRVVAAGRHIHLNWDAPIFLDGAWRALQGQRAHTDFSTPFGPVMFWIFAWGQLVLGHTAQGVELGVALTALAFAVWAIAAMASRRGGGALSYVAALCVATYLLTTRMMGYSSRHHAYTGYYNAFGFALVMVVLWESAAPSPRDRPFARGLSAGLLTVVLVFTKVTFGFAAAFFAALGVLTAERPRRRFAGGLAAGLAAATFAFAVHYRFDFGPVLADWRAVALIRSASGAFSLPRFGSALLAGAPGKLLAVAVLAVLFRSRAPMRLRAKLALLLGASLAMDLVLTLGITQSPESIVPAFAAATCLVALRRDAPDPAGLPWRVAACLAVALFAVTIESNAIPWPTYRTPLLKNERLRGYAADWLFEPVYNEALGVLGAGLRPCDRILTIDFPNVFSYAFALPARRGELLYWHRGVTYHPSPSAHAPELASDAVLRDVTYVLFPHHERWDAGDLFLLQYGARLAAGYTLHARTEHWSVYRRNAPCDPASLPAASTR